MEFADEADGLIADASTRMKEWGPLQGSGFSSVKLEAVNGLTRCELEGVATFSKASKKQSFTLIKEGETYKVSKFNFE